MPAPVTEKELAEAGEDRLPGIAYFHDSWRITDATIEEAETFLSEERQLANAVAALARDGDHFDELISIVEGGWVSDPEEDLSLGEREALGAHVWDIPPDLGSLELGVAGLSYALNAVGLVTASSCRGHLTPEAWSQIPVVAFASTRQGAVVLQTLAWRVGCTFFLDEVRPELLVVAGRSIRDTMNLAGLVVDNRHAFDDAVEVAE